jgi:DNA-binding NarL/FixJ family response regulator
LYRAKCAYLTYRCEVKQSPELVPGAGPHAIDRSPRQARLRVCIVGNVRLYREGLAQILERSDRVEVVGVAPIDGGASAVALLQPDVVLMDAILPEATAEVARIVAAAPATPVVAVSASDAGDDVVAFGEAGVSGFVPRDGSVVDLMAVLECVSRGEAPVPPRAAARLLEHLRARAAHDEVPDPPSRLTAREAEVVELLAAGLSNKEIAGHLGIALATVKNHVHSILLKLDVSGRTDVGRRPGLRPRPHPLGQEI